MGLTSRWPLWWMNTLLFVLIAIEVHGNEMPTSDGTAKEDVHDNTIIVASRVPDNKPSFPMFRPEFPGPQLPPRPFESQRLRPPPFVLPPFLSNTGFWNRPWFRFDGSPVGMRPFPFMNINSQGWFAANEQQNQQQHRSQTEQPQKQQQERFQENPEQRRQHQHGEQQKRHHQNNGQQQHQGGQKQHQHGQHQRRHHNREGGQQQQHSQKQQQFQSQQHQNQWHVNRQQEKNNHVNIDENNGDPLTEHHGFQVEPPPFSLSNKRAQLEKTPTSTLTPPSQESSHHMAPSRTERTISQLLPILLNALSGATRSPVMFTDKPFGSEQQQFPVHNRPPIDAFGNMPLGLNSGTVSNFINTGKPQLPPVQSVNFQNTMGNMMNQFSTAGRFPPPNDVFVQPQLAFGQSSSMISTSHPSNLRLPNNGFPPNNVAFPNGPMHQHHHQQRPLPPPPPPPLPGPPPQLSGPLPLGSPLPPPMHAMASHSQRPIFSVTPLPGQTSPFPTTVMHPPLGIQNPIDAPQFDNGPWIPLIRRQPHDWRPLQNFQGDDGRKIPSGVSPPPFPSDTNPEDAMFLSTTPETPTRNAFNDDFGSDGNEFQDLDYRSSENDFMKNPDGFNSETSKSSEVVQSSRVPPLATSGRKKRPSFSSSSTSSVYIPKPTTHTPVKSLMSDLLTLVKAVTKIPVDRDTSLGTPIISVESYTDMPSMQNTSGKLATTSDESAGRDVLSGQHTKTFSRRPTTWIRYKITSDSPRITIRPTASIGVHRTQNSWTSRLPYSPAMPSILPIATEVSTAKIPKDTLVKVSYSSKRRYFDGLKSTDKINNYWNSTGSTRPTESTTDMVPSKHHKLRAKNMDSGDVQDRNFVGYIERPPMTLTPVDWSARMDVTGMKENFNESYAGQLKVDVMNGSSGELGREYSNLERGGGGRVLARPKSRDYQLFESATSLMKQGGTLQSSALLSNRKRTIELSSRREIDPNLSNADSVLLNNRIGVSNANNQSSQAAITNATEKLATMELKRNRNDVIGVSDALQDYGKSRLNLATAEYVTEVVDPIENTYNVTPAKNERLELAPVNDYELAEESSAKSYEKQESSSETTSPHSGGQYTTSMLKTKRNKIAVRVRRRKRPILSTPISEKNYYAKRTI